MATQGKILVYKREAKKGVTFTYRIEAGRDPITGKRKQVTKSGFKSAKEARAAAQPILNKLLLGENIVQSDITFGEFVEKWFDSYKLNIKLPTQVRYRYTIGTFNKFFRYKKMKDITRIYAIGSLVPLSSSSILSKLFLIFIFCVLNIENTAAASVDEIIDPKSKDNIKSKPNIKWTTIPIINAVMTTPTVDNDSPGLTIGFINLTSVSRPPENIIIIRAKILIVWTSS